MPQAARPSIAGESSRSEDHRKDAAWFGQGAQIKQRALDTALKLVA